MHQRVKQDDQLVMRLEAVYSVESHAGPYDAAVASAVSLVQDKVLEGRSAPQTLVCEVVARLPLDLARNVGRCWGRCAHVPIIPIS